MERPLAMKAIIAGLEIMQAGRIDDTPAWRNLMRRSGKDNIVSGRVTTIHFTNLDAMGAEVSFDSYYWTGRGCPLARRTWRPGLSEEASHG